MCALTVKLVKSRRQHEGRCNCGHWAAAGPTEGSIREQYPIHLALKGK